MKARAADPAAAEFPKIMKELPTKVPDNLNPFMDRMGLKECFTTESTENTEKRCTNSKKSVKALSNLS